MGEDLWVTQSGAGSADGSSLGNAWSAANFNTSGNWGAGAGKISAGDTVRLSGVFTTALTTQGNGSVGNVITVHGEAGMTFRSTVLADNCVSVANSYVVLDNVFVENTANGNGLANTLRRVGINVTADNVTVQGCQVSNLFVRAQNSSDATDGGIGINFLNVNHLLCRSNTIVQGGTLAIALGRTAAASYTDWQVYSNTLLYSNMGVQGYDNVNSKVGNVSVFGNTIDYMSYWDGTGTVPATYHHNGIYIWAENTGSGITNLFIYGNRIGPHLSTNVQSSQASSGISVTCSSFAGAVSNLYIYNNYIYVTNGNTAGDGLVWLWGPQTVRVLNNSIYCDTMVDGMRVESGTDVQILNNIISKAVSSAIYSDTATAISICDSNVYFVQTNMTYNGGGVTYAQWKTHGFDAGSQVGDPLFVAPLLGDLSITTNSPARDAGTSLSAYFTTDIFGTARPQQSAWDIGAFEFVPPPTVFPFTAANCVLRGVQ